MSAALVFKEYTQQALDWEYDNRRKVPGAADLMSRYGESSREARARLHAQLDVAYGASSAETLDIFSADSAAPAPIQVFYHGGYWRALHKDDFSYVALAFQPAGAVTAVVNYALIPSVDMDELVRQCRAALAWIWRNASSFGGDRERICISGHSAGGHLVAMMMATDWPAFEPGLPQDLVKAGCGISGLYDLEPIRLCYLQNDLHLSERDVENNSPVNLPRHNSGPLLLPLGDQEGPEYLRQSNELAAAWKHQGSAPKVMIMAGMNHFTIASQLESPDSELSRIIQAQMGI